MGRKAIDLTGQRFGKLTVISRKENIGNSAAWLCQCDCGNTTIQTRNNLRQGNVKSCGCSKRNQPREVIESRIKSLRKNNWVEGTNLNSLRSEANKQSKSGIRGVTFNKQQQKWCASLTLKGQRVLCKLFSNKQDAINARAAAERKYFAPILEKYGRERL
ncbi:MAG TPA: alcohol dehydrogenase [Ligilactobacillus acidipiscis]|uniref:Alcohol dehydrogenase n=1 Tax=Ligilactobacillus acidipiscis TaxID=89059 RepID=A0A921F7E5_9LACO|nr:alcohol dehydrogenase [Ligilactobacillus acidipiscis]